MDLNMTGKQQLLAAKVKFVIAVFFAV